MVDVYGRWYPDYPGQQPFMDPQFNRLQGQQSTQTAPNNALQPRQSTIPSAMTPPIQQGNSMIWVSGKDEADKWPVIPGNAVALWDSNAAIVYLRQADNTGKPSTKVYDLVERTEAPAPRQVPQVDLSKYLTAEAAEEMIDRRVNDILAERLKRTSKPSKPKEEE